MKDNQITFPKHILLLFFLLLTGCQIFVSKDEPEIIQEPWEKLSIEKKIAQMIMFRLKGDLTNDSSFEYKKFHRWINEIGIGSDEVFESQQIQETDEIFNNVDLFGKFKETIFGEQESISVDDEAMMFYISSSVKDLWKNIFSSKDYTNTIKIAEKNLKSKSEYKKNILKLCFEDD